MWPFCWWIAIVVDHFSRRVLETAAFTKEPTSEGVQRFLDCAIKKAGSAPDHLISDQGIQFTADDFEPWCRRRGIRHRFGAVGKYGSIAIVERLIRSLKNECTRRILVPFRKAEVEKELALWAGWYNADRPHDALVARTPDEVNFGCRPACRSPRFEPRPGWPRAAPCAAPHALVRGRLGARLELRVSYRSGRRHLPIGELQRAA